MLMSLWSADVATLTHQEMHPNPWNIHGVLLQLACTKHPSVKSAYWIREAFQIQVKLGERWVQVSRPYQRACDISWRRHLPAHMCPKETQRPSSLATVCCIP